MVFEAHAVDHDFLVVQQLFLHLLVLLEKRDLLASVVDEALPIVSHRLGGQGFEEHWQRVNISQLGVLGVVNGIDSLDLDGEGILFVWCHFLSTARFLV